MRCPGCGSENPAQVRFCGQCGCGVALRNRCPECGAENPAEFGFCGTCGHSLAKSPPASSTQTTDTKPTPATAAELPEGERKTVTALFADIKGSMDLQEHLDPEEARALIDPVLKMMMEAAHRYHGFVAQSTGDGVFALFGAPIAFEDHPHRAIHAALAMQAEVRRHSAGRKAEGFPALEIRVGINTGEVVVRTIKTDQAHTEYSPVGHSAGIAQRMQRLASPGGIAVSEHTRRLTEGYFEFKPLGPRVVKGLSEPLDVYEVIGAGPMRTRFEVSEQRGLSRFVGRERELRQIADGLELAVGGHGQIVAIVGEPGIGKSRLFHEFKAEAGERSRILPALSVSHGKASPYAPIVELLELYFGIVPGDDVAARRGKIETALTSLDSALADIAPHLFALLSPEKFDPVKGPKVEKYQILGAVKRLLLRESLKRPLVLMLEDLHWYDDASLALLNMLADAIASAPVLMLVNYRPEFRHQWSNRSYYIQVRLNPLPERGAEEMLTALLGDRGELSQLKHLIIHKTEGNPFFIEETVRALFEEGALARNGSVSIVRPIAEIAIPATVQSVLSARIDRLSAPEKETLQTAAVIGKFFSFPVLREVMARSEPEVQGRLYNLQLAEFVYEQPASFGPEYSFKHALTQEVAYNSVLIERRKLLHEQVAHTLETVFSDRLDKVYADLARHYRRSNNVEKAVDCAVRAGDAAEAVHGELEAIAHFSAALELAERSNFDEVRIAEILLRLGPLMGATDASGGVAYLDRALAVFERIGDGQKTASLHCHLAQIHSSMAFGVLDLEASLRHVAHAEELLAGRPSRELVGAYVTAARCERWRGNVAGWSLAAERAMRIADALNDDRARASALGPLGGSLWAAGKMAASFEALERSWKLSESLELPENYPPILQNAAFNLFNMGDFKGGKAWLSRGLHEPRFTEHQFRAWLLPMALAGLLCSGEMAQAERLMSLHPWAAGAAELPNLVAYARGDLETAESLYRASVENSRSQGRRENVCSYGYVHAHLQRQLRKFAEAERTSLEVIAVAEKDCYVTFQLRGWEGLATTYVRTGRLEQASEALAECHKIVANGEDWRDLFGAIARTEAMLAAANNRWDEASPKFAQAVDSARRYENFQDVLWRLSDWGSELVKAGRREEGIAKFDEAIAHCQSVSAHPRWIERIDVTRRDTLAVA